MSIVLKDLCESVDIPNTKRNEGEFYMVILTSWDKSDFPDVCSVPGEQRLARSEARGWSFPNASYREISYADFHNSILAVLLNDAQTHWLYSI